MIVVADASPLNYLILIHEVHILHLLYGKILIPDAVCRELQHAGTPPEVAEWMAHPPDWLEICGDGTPDERLMASALP